MSGLLQGRESRGEAMGGKRHTLGWLEVDDVGELLATRHKEINPWSVSFTRLKELVMRLPEFEEEPGHPCNERILEEIQRAWIEEREGRTQDEE